MLNYLAYPRQHAVIGRADFPGQSAAAGHRPASAQTADLPRLMSGTRLHAGMLVAW